MVKKIKENEFQEAIKSGVSVVDFSAVWCGPCKMMEPVLEGVSEEMNGKVSFFNVDVDENTNLAQAYGIASIPALIVFKDGVKQDMQIGFVPKESIVDFIQKQL